MVPLPCELYRSPLGVILFCVLCIYAIIKDIFFCSRMQWEVKTLWEKEHKEVEWEEMRKHGTLSLSRWPSSQDLKQQVSVKELFQMCCSCTKDVLCKIWHTFSAPMSNIWRGRQFILESHGLCASDDLRGFAFQCVVTCHGGRGTEISWLLGDQRSQLDWDSDKF